MVLAYPLSIPTVHKIVQRKFDIVRLDSADYTRGGHMSVAQLGPGYWRAECETSALTEEIFGQWSGFFDALRGSQKLFYLFDPLRRYGLNYPATVAVPNPYSALARHGGAAGSFSAGTADWGTILANRDGFRLGATSKLPTSYIAKMGDMISLAWTVSSVERRSLHRVTADATAVNGVMDVLVEPTLPSTVGATGTASLANAAGIFRIDPDVAPDVWIDASRIGHVKFTAIQQVYNT